MASHIVVNTCGAHGSSGFAGSAGFLGASGGNGGHGTHAASARPVVVNLRFEGDPASGTALIGDTSSGELRYRTVPSVALGSTTIAVVARGGDGGDGGPGGDGGRGRHGNSGRNATRHHHGTNGEDGGPGGDGGHGGSGGAAGSGGPVSVSVGFHDTDLLMLLDSVDVAAGRPGSGGAGGRGGDGGSGGSGGSSYSWTEHTEHDGEKRSVTHTQHGGFSGSRGMLGRTGTRGCDGELGRPGSLLISVVREQDGAVIASATDPYNVFISQLEPVGSLDGVLEPGEEFALRGVTLVNNGALPTPAVQPIVVSVVPNEWVEPLGPPAALSTSIPPGASVTLDHLAPLRFRLRNAFALVPNTVPVARPTLQFSAFVSRVNKRFAAVEAEFKTLEVRYPLQLSLVYGDRTVGVGEEAPFVVVVRNVSQRPSYACSVSLTTVSHLRADVMWRSLSLDSGPMRQFISGPAPSAPPGIAPSSTLSAGDVQATPFSAKLGLSSVPSSETTNDATDDPSDGSCAPLPDKPLSAASHEAVSVRILPVASSQAPLGRGLSEPAEEPTREADSPDGGLVAPIQDSIQSLEQSLVDPVQWMLAAGRIPPGGALALRGTLRFTSPATPAYSQLSLETRLTLAHSGVTVQLSDSTLQLGQRYVFDPGADVLLAVTSATTAAEIARWSAVVRRLGTRMSVWNVSMYGGFDLGFVQRNGATLAQELRGRVLVILNARYALDAARTKHIVQDDLRIEEIYAAASTSGVHTLIVDDPQAECKPFTFHGVRPSRGVFDIPHAFPGCGASGAGTRTPLLPAAEASAAYRGDVRDAVRVHQATRDSIAAYPCVERYGTRNPRADDVASAAKKVARDLQRTCPADQHLVVYRFSPASEPLATGCCSETRSLGVLRVFGGLSAVVPCVGTTAPAPRCTDDQHTFAITRLLPLERKLEMLIAATSPNAIPLATSPVQLLLVAILADIADEQWAWRREAWSGAFPRARLERPDCLAVLRSFASADLRPLLATQGGEQAAVWLVARVHALLGALPSSLDYCWFWRRQRIVSSVSLAIIRPLVNRIPTTDFKRCRAEATAEYQRLHGGRDALWAAVRNPLGDSRTVFQHHCPAAVACSEEQLVSTGAAPPLVRHIVDSPNAFAQGAEGDAHRDAAVAAYERQAHADASPVSHYSLRPGAVDAPDNVSAARVFRGVVRR